MESRLLETIILTIINAFGAFLIIIVLSNSFKEKLFRWFTVLTIALLGWVDFAYIGYFSDNPDLATTAYRINLAFVVLFFYSAYIFYIESFLKVNNKIFRIILTTICLILGGLSLFTNAINNGVIPQDWGNEVKFGEFDIAFTLFAAVMTVIFLYYFISRYISLPKVDQRKIIFFLVGTFFLICFNVVFNILSPTLTGTARYQHFGDYSAVAFLFFTAFAMVKRSFLNVKVAFTAFIITLIGTFLLIDIIVLSNNLPEQLVKIVMFILFIFASILLVRSVLNEIKQKEQLAVVNKELAESKALIQQKAEEQKDILDVIGHEVRTPLTAIIQRVKLLKKTVMTRKEDALAGKLSPDEIQKDLTELYKFVEVSGPASTQMNETVNTSLEFAKIDNLKFVPTFEEFDLIPIIKDAVLVMSDIAVKDASEILFDLAIEKLPIKADKQRIGEAIYALLSNAIKYGKNPNNKINRVSVQLENSSGYVDLSVKDSGIGISQEDISKLGTKFKRLADKTGSGLKRPGGTGLGLFVVKGIMEMHKGDLIIKSEGIGKGSEFILHFPIAPKE